MTETHSVSSNADAAEIDAIANSAAQVLRIGLILAAVPFLIGLIVIALSDQQLQQRVDPVGQVWEELRQMHGSGFVDLGIVILLLTPVAAVATIAVLFLRMGDKRYGYLTIAVLGILIVSIAVALAR